MGRKKLVKLKFLDLVIILVIAALVVSLGFVIYYQKPEPVTELYFENHTSLPRYSTGDNFSFIIHNLENRDTTYDVHIYIENDKNTTDIDRFQTKLKDGELKKFTTEFKLASDYKLNKIVVDLVGRNQSIYYWVYYTEALFVYPDYNERMAIDCIPIYNATNGNVTIKLKGKYGPGILVYENGIMTQNITMNDLGNESAGLSLNFPAYQGILDIVFWNDLYNATTGLDRNVYLDEVVVDDGHYSNALYDRGSGKMAFDCVETGMQSGMPWNGAFRFNIKRNINASTGNIIVPE